MTQFVLITGIFFFQLGVTPCKAEQLLGGMELQEKMHKNNSRIQKIMFRKNLQLKGVC